MCTHTIGKAEQLNIGLTLDILLRTIDPKDLLEVSITGYQQCGDFQGDLIMPLISIKLREI